ncbi:hypothetical protein FRC12_012684 [Ceratobasidium sp. 428]|nr:hypothetical protein FRC12_012684 [Ceratobasidium sp. 428]
MLKISAAKEIKPYFEDEYGDPDTLPAQFVDPDTNYCMPYPHWKAPLTKQVAWIPTFIQRFRATIPNDSSELSTILRDLSDEQIVILLNDGPFRTAQSAWRDLKKSDEEIEGMRKYSRKYQRTERKATSRGRFIQTIPTLQGPEWEFLSTVGYMSCDESDDKGGLITKRPEYRATWVTNLYRAIEVAQLEKAKSQPGLCPRPPRRTVLMSNLPVPHLERSTGSSMVTIRIAQCAISGSWRKVNTGNLSKFAQSLDSRVTKKPDIGSFLALHPMPNDDDTDAGDDADESGQDDCQAST